MKIDLTSLLTNQTQIISINEDLIIDNSILKGTIIRDIKYVHFFGNIIKNNEIFTISGNLKGLMILPDDLTLEDVDYDFDIKIEENFTENDENYENKLKIVNNLLDIFPFLWQNILLEVPSKIRGASTNLKLSGNNWRVITEDELKNTNQGLSELKVLFDKRKE